MNYAAANALSGAMSAKLNSRTEVEAQRLPASDAILTFADALAEQAEALANQAHEKLATVMHSALPSPGIDKSSPMEDYPPLFDKLRSRLLSIEESLNRIGSAISRTEL